MVVKIFCPSLISDWDNRSAHFLRGVGSALVRQGHTAQFLEPRGSEPVENLLDDRGPSAIAEFHRHYPDLHSIAYEVDTLDLEEVLAGADLLLVSACTDSALIERLGEQRRRVDTFRSLLRDASRNEREMERTPPDLSGFDGVLASGDFLRRKYLESGEAKRAWTWREGADETIFHPVPRQPLEGDVVWVGNWGPTDRLSQFEEFLIGPVRDLGLRAKLYGTGFPAEVLQRLHESGIEFGGSIANSEVPVVFARYRLTVHMPRSGSLPGVPAMQMFEAMACGIPLISAPWNDIEHLFSPGEDYFVAEDSSDVKRKMLRILDHPAEAARIADRGRATILARHTCTHRVGELMAILDDLRPGMSA
jgi:spore maturation protein CgeB